MGMFDTITVETGLPDGGSNLVAFETKDFGAALRKFRITSLGNLEIRDTEWRPFDHQGLVTFYDGERVYTAKFARGRLIGMRAGDSDAWVNVDEGVDPWEVLENVHTALENLEYDSVATDRLRKYIARALEGHLDTGIGPDTPHLG
jgi:hypothetical protein